MGEVVERVLDEFYSRQDKTDVQLIRRQGAKAPWFVIEYASNQKGMGFNDEAKARKAFQRLKIQNQDI